MMKDRKYRASGLAAAILVLNSGVALPAGWTEINTGLPSSPVGPEVLTIDPSAPSTIYARTLAGSLFKSTDRGEHWNVLRAVTGVFSLAIDPRNSSTLYAGTAHGILKSTDGGGAWRGASNGLEQNYVSSITIDPVTPSTLYAVSRGLFKSTDAGESWYAIASPSGDFLLRGVVIDPQNSSTIYALSYPEGIFKSTDAGASWKLLTAGLPLRGNPSTPSWSILGAALAIDPVTPSAIYFDYVEFSSGPPNLQLVKSTDGGVTWAALDPGVPSALIGPFAIDPKTPATVYALYASFAGAARGILKTTDGGRTWSIIATGLPEGTPFGSLAIDPVSPSSIYSGFVDYFGTGGFVKSADGGSSWNRADAGLSVIDIRVLTIDPVNASTLYTASRSDGLFKSTNSGTSWAQAASFASVLSLVIDYAHPNILYAATQRANGCISADDLLFRSVDGGVIWSNSIGQPGSGCNPSAVMALDPSDPNTLYAGGEDDNDDDDNAGAWLSKSPDGATGWSTPAFIASGGLNSLAIDRKNPSTLYAGTSYGVFKSADAGATWSDAGGLGTTVSALAIDPVNPDILYAAQGIYPVESAFAGLFKSMDAGANWSPMNAGMESLIDTKSPVTSLAIDPDNPGVLYAGTSGYGVFRTIDGGAHWSAFNDGLTILDVRVLALAPNALYAGTTGGVFAISIAH